MIVGKRKIHQRADHDLSVAHDRPVLDPVHAKHGRPRRIDDRRRQQRAEHSTVGDREGARSEEHTSELQSLMRTPYALFCWKKKSPPAQPSQLTIGEAVSYCATIRNATERKN